MIYGYDRGVYYFEKEKRFYEFFIEYKNQGAMSIFCSLITVLDKVNDSYTINELGSHTKLRKNLLNQYKSYGIKRLNYEPAIFDKGDTKFIYVRQEFSHSFESTIKIKKFKKPFDFNLSNFFGK